MAYFTKYRSEWTERGNTYQCDIRVDESSQPAIQTFDVTESVNLRFDMANRETLTGMLNWYLSVNGVFDSATLLSLSDDIRTQGSILILCNLYRNDKLFFEGYLQPINVSRLIDSFAKTVYTLKFSGNISISKNITTDRITTVSPTTTVYVWMFETVPGFIFSSVNGKGVVAHDWRPLGQAPSSGFETGFLGVEFNPNLYQDDKISDLNDALADMFQYNYGFSWRYGQYGLCHIERIPENVYMIEGSSRTFVWTFPQLINAVDIGSTINNDGLGYGYYEVLADGAERGAPVDLNTFAPEYRRDLRWDMVSDTPAVKGLNYNDSVVDLTYDSATYVNPASKATDYDIEDAMIFVVREYFGLGSDVIYATLHRDIVDPIFPMWIATESGGYFVRLRYGQLDLSWNKTSRVEAVVLSRSDTYTVSITGSRPMTMRMAHYAQTDREYVDGTMTYYVPDGYSMAIGEVNKLADFDVFFGEDDGVLSPTDISFILDFSLVRVGFLDNIYIFPDFQEYYEAVIADSGTFYDIAHTMDTLDFLRREEIYCDNSLIITCADGKAGTLYSLQL